MTDDSTRKAIDEMVEEAKSKGMMPHDIFIAIVDPNSKPGRDYLEMINTLSGTPLPENPGPQTRRFLILSRRQAEGLIVFMTKHGYPVIGALNDPEWSVITLSDKGARVGGPSDDLLN